MERDAGPEVAGAFVEVAQADGEDEEDEEAIGHKVDAGEDEAGGDDGEPAVGDGGAAIDVRKRRGGGLVEDGVTFVVNRIAGGRNDDFPVLVFLFRSECRIFLGEKSPALFHEDGLDQAPEKDFFQDGCKDAGDEEEGDAFPGGDVVAAEKLERFVGFLFAFLKVLDEEGDEDVEQDEERVDDKETEQAVGEAAGDFAEGESPSIDSAGDEAPAEEKDDEDGENFGKGVGDLQEHRHVGIFQGGACVAGLPAGPVAAAVAGAVRARPAAGREAATTLVGR